MVNVAPGQCISHSMDLLRCTASMAVASELVLGPWSHVWREIHDPILHSLTALRQVQREETQEGRKEIGVLWYG